MTDSATIEDTGAELITIPHKTDVPALFSKDGGISGLIAEIEKQARAVVVDTSTAAGRKDAKSLAAKVTRSKTLIDEVGKEQNDERNALTKAVNAQRNLAKDRLDALRDEIRAPVEAWETAQADRKRQFLIRMDTFDLEQVSSHDTSVTIQGIINAIDGTPIDATWEEYEADAKAAKAASLVKYNSDLEVAKAREAQEAELETLRAEKTQRDQESAQRAIDAQNAESEAEREAQAAAVAKTIADEAEARIKFDKEAAEKRHADELAASKQREEQAAQAERDRIAAKQKVEDDAATARAADKKHRRKIRTEIVKALADMNAANFEEMVDAMLAGEIVHVKVVI